MTRTIYPHVLPRRQWTMIWLCTILHICLYRMMISWITSVPCGYVIYPIRTIRMYRVLRIFTCIVCWTRIVHISYTNEHILRQQWQVWEPLVWSIDYIANIVRILQNGSLRYMKHSKLPSDVSKDHQRDYCEIITVYGSTLHHVGK